MSKYLAQADFALPVWSRSTKKTEAEFHAISYRYVIYKLSIFTAVIKAWSGIFLSEKNLNSEHVLQKCLIHAVLARETRLNAEVMEIGMKSRWQDPGWSKTWRRRFIFHDEHFLKNVLINFSTYLMLLLFLDSKKLAVLKFHVLFWQYVWCLHTTIIPSP